MEQAMSGRSPEHRDAPGPGARPAFQPYSPLTSYGLLGNSLISLCLSFLTSKTSKQAVPPPPRRMLGGFKEAHSTQPLASSQQMLLAVAVFLKSDKKEEAIPFHPPFPGI